MSRKSLIICLALLAAMILGVGIAVAFLYSGTGDGARKGNAVPDEERYLLLPAVPADAAFVACLSDMTVSIHYNGSLQTLYVFDAGKASPEPSEEAAAVIQSKKEEGMTVEYVDCSKVTGSKRNISRRSVILASQSETLVKSSKRHLEQSISVMDAAGFSEAAKVTEGGDVMFFSNVHSKMLMPEMFAKKYSSQHPFVASLAQWTVVGIDKADASGVYLTAYPVFGNDPSEFMTVLSESDAGPSKVAHMLPSYTISAISLPMSDTEPYVTAYQKYADSRQALQNLKKKRRDLATKGGIRPEEFVKRLDVKEVAKASFIVGSSVEEVNLMRIEREDTLLFVGMKDKSFKDYVPAPHLWPYASFLSSVFGGIFELKDESCFTYMNGWVISGSIKAVKEYVSGRALSYGLVEYMADAGQKNMLSSQDASLLAYYSFTEYPKGRTAVFSGRYDEIMKPYYSDCDYCPSIVTVRKTKGGMRMGVQIPKLEMLRTKAPEFVRDTTVIIPQGPFKVKNSGTGKTNFFYQNQHGAICLQEEGGKGLWGVQFKGKLCGTAYNVDYYANGKLQIIFGSGSQIYIIDRLGHYVNGFPLDLGKEILLGPDVYDFNGHKAYNIMVLHKDNTIEMYNLKGKKPSSWKTITAAETIKGLPERIEVGGRTFWVVRTAIQTLIYPFGGGTSITSFKGDEMIRPDSRIEIMDAASVNVSCYDGKTRNVKLK